MSKRWSKEEEERLLHQVRLFPHNLTKCFFIVADITGRTPKAVASHWYNVTSKSETICFFTASSKSVAKNRKNAKGIKTSRNIWHRLLDIIRKI